jgi:hypothetical protein
VRHLNFGRAAEELPLMSPPLTTYSVQLNAGGSLLLLACAESVEDESEHGLRAVFRS